MSSVTIGGTTAYYEKDSNTGDQIHIRAMVAGGSEYGPKSTDVVINLSNAGATINGDLAFTGAGNVRTATNVNLLNKVYTVIIAPRGAASRPARPISWLPALPNGVVAIAPNDPPRITALKFGTVDATFTGTNVQNPFMGNTLVNTENKWTFVNYKADATATATITDRKNVAANLTIPTGMTASGGCLGTTSSRQW